MNRRHLVFWKRIDKSAGPTGCWLWTGAVNNSGYGEVQWDRRAVLVHRLVWALSRFEELDNLDVLHRCDERRCCNPAHLFLGTHQENMKDMIAKGRDRKARGEAHGMARLTKALVLKIRAEYACGHGSWASLAKKYKVSKRTVGRVLSGKNWGEG